MPNHCFKHLNLNWARERLEEIKATLESLENRAEKLPAMARSHATRTLADIRKARENFDKYLRENGTMAETGSSQSRDVLQKQWVLFEASAKAFLESSDVQAKDRESAFRARAEAQRRAWKEVIAKLHESAKTLSVGSRTEIETAAKHMKVDADAAKTKLEKIRKAGSDSWVTMETALGETRAAFDNANRAAHEFLTRAA